MSHSEHQQPRNEFQGFVREVPSGTGNNSARGHFFDVSLGIPFLGEYGTVPTFASVHTPVAAITAAAELPCRFGRIVKNELMCEENSQLRRPGKVLLLGTIDIGLQMVARQRQKSCRQLHML